VRGLHQCKRDCRKVLYKKPPAREEMLFHKNAHLVSVSPSKFLVNFPLWKEKPASILPSISFSESLFQYYHFTHTNSHISALTWAFLVHFLAACSRLDCSGFHVTLFKFCFWASLSFSVSCLWKNEKRTSTGYKICGWMLITCRTKQQNYISFLLISFFVSKRSKIFLDQSSWMSSPQLGSARHYLLSFFCCQDFLVHPHPCFFSSSFLSWFVFSIFFFLSDTNNIF
jgi:hypothetical protein